MYIMNYYLSQLGYQGPNTLLLLILIMLFKTNQLTNIYLYVYVIVWQITSHFINIVIKNILQYPRPDSDKNENFKDLTPTIDNYFSIHKNFGMPSGHAQAVISELTFITLYFKKPVITIISILQAGITLWQRYATRRHSINQLVIGSGIGIVFGLSFYKIIPFIISHYTPSPSSEIL
jgi:membrane-associated phospholipid phosphatase